MLSASANAAIVERIWGRIGRGVAWHRLTDALGWYGGMMHRTTFSSIPLQTTMPGRKGRHQKPGRTQVVLDHANIL